MTIHLGKKKLLSFIDHLPLGIVFLNADNLITDCNLAFSRMFGFEGSELTNQNIKVIMPSYSMPKLGEYVGVKKIMKRCICQ